MRCERLHDSAVYVLGALPPPEREAYERHLADCGQCRAEVAEFSDLPGLLGRLDPESAAQIALASDLPDEPRPGRPGPTSVLSPPSPATPASPAAVSSPPAPAAWVGPTATDPSLGRLNGSAPASGGPAAERVDGSAADPLLPRVLDRARSAQRTERRRRRWRTAGTALVAAFLGVAAVIGVRAAGVGQPDYVAMQEVAATVPVTASLALDSDPDGTVVRMRCAYRAGESDEYAKWTFTLVVVPKSGDPQEINTWTARSGDEMQLTAHSNIQRSNIQRIEIRNGDGTPLLSLAA
ncbi:zf-HC2 domain-containing protein [Dactylosporangium sp. NPDC051485]|uniref:anti-sigma factor family protein n=1 Tax=Dactylosporangium sp. NPDC051485 TaxID=3154846 RepID=UPI00343A4AE6